MVHLRGAEGGDVVQPTAVAGHKQGVSKRVILGTKAKTKEIDMEKPTRILFARARRVAIRSRSHHLVRFSIVGGFAIMAAYSAFLVHAAPDAEPKPATAATQAYLEQFSASLPFADREDFELATRGFVAAVPGNRILDAKGNLLRDLNVEGFFSQPAPATENPSLWRNAGLVAKSGLFKVSDRVYQVRGVDAANMTIVLGDTGFIVIDS